MKHQIGNFKIASISRIIFLHPTMMSVCYVHTLIHLLNVAHMLQFVVIKRDEKLCGEKKMLRTPLKLKILFFYYWKKSLKSIKESVPDLHHEWDSRIFRKFQIARFFSIKSLDVWFINVFISPVGVLFA